MSASKKLFLDEVILDERCQARADVNHDAVNEYAEAYASGTELPPPSVFFVSGKAYLVDGFHRVPAAIKAGKNALHFDVVGTGDMDAAIWAAAAVNKSHGVRRTNADKRRAVKLALGLRSDASNRAIASHIGVSDVFVGKVRDELQVQTVSTCVGDQVQTVDTSKGAQVQTVSTSEPAKRKGKDGKLYPAKQPKAAPEPAAEEPEAAEVVELSEDEMPEYGEVLESYAAALRDLRLGLDSGAIPGQVGARLADDIKRAEQTARFAVPVQCPSCLGAGCKWCNDLGWMPRSAAESAKRTMRRIDA